MLAPLSTPFMQFQLFLNVKCVMLQQLWHLMKSLNTILSPLQTLMGHSSALLPQEDCEFKYTKQSELLEY